MKTHWVADMYPLNESDIEPLSESIKANGQRTPILALKDGTIIDGRNRWLACQKAGVDPIITIINPDGEDVSEEKLWAIATDCNSMRRDMTSSLRACLAAESWKRLYPNGAPGKGARNDLKPNPKDGAMFAKFAKDSFKIGSTYAEMAQAILNYSPELLESAKSDLAGVYKTYQSRVSEDREKRQNLKMLEAPDNSDIRERVANSQLALDEAITLLRKRHEDELSSIRAESDRRANLRGKLQDLSGFLYMFGEKSPEEIADLITAREGESVISDPSKRSLGKEELTLISEKLNQIATIL